MRVQRRLQIAFMACSMAGVAAQAAAAPPRNTQAAPAHGTQSALLTAPSGVRAPTFPNAASPSVAPIPTHGDTVSPAVMGPEEHTRRMRAAVVALNSSDPVAIQNGLHNFSELKGRAAADAIVARLKTGLSPQLTETALEVLSGLQQPSAAALLAEFTLHRRWQIRQKAVSALGRLRVRSSVSVLLYALDDPSPEVRSAAARALGLAGDPRAITTLNAALARGVDGALEGLAHLVPSKQVDGILRHAKADLTNAAPALDILIARQNLPPVTRLKVVSFVQSHDAEQAAEQILAGWREQLKAKGDLRMLQALSPKASPTPLVKTAGPSAPSAPARVAAAPAPQSHGEAKP